jgi:hypothetical protein
MPPTHLAPAGLDPQSRYPHHPCYPLVIDHNCAATQLVGHAAVAVARQFILNVFDDCRQFGVGQRFGPRGGAVVIGAARQVHGFAPSTD